MPKPLAPLRKKWNWALVLRLATGALVLAGAAVGDIVLLAIGALWLGMLANTSLSTLMGHSNCGFCGR